MHLPQAFLEKMAGLLGDEFPQFLQSLDQREEHGLRVNTLRVSVDRFLNMVPWVLEAVPWCNTGFYYLDDDRPGKHVYHEAGLYYIQEPSAMAVAELLAPEPGEWVLDLAAAPGGKATHIAVLMKGKGLVVANEVNRGRSQALSQNVERLGITNTIVTNETPERLANHFGPVFDRILLDAPCSGEGMFRKNPQAQLEWSQAHVESCAVRQGNILSEVPKLLRPGGRLVYSTCTFSPEENEGAVARFLEEHKDFVVEAVHHDFGISPGQPEWAGGKEELRGTARLWPHKLRGEGHFVAVLRRKNEGDGRRPMALGSRRLADVPEYKEFLSSTLLDIPQGSHLLFGEQLYLVPKDTPSLEGLRVVRPGLHIGTFKKNRFEPAHALAHTLRVDQVKSGASFASDADELQRYLRGETLQYAGPDGWYLISVEGFGLGWAKLVKGTLKNHLPKGLRQL